MSRKYKFHDKYNLYFISFAVVNWIDVFIRTEYKDILIDSWNYCIKNKDLKIYAWFIMTNHVHMIVSSSKDELSDIMRDMKSFTSNQLRKSILTNPKESRKDWMLFMMKKFGIENNNNNDYQFWQQHNHPIILDSNFILDQKIDYIHNNPVKTGFVTRAEDYLYSSAIDYAGEKGLIEIIKIE